MEGLFSVREVPASNFGFSYSQYSYYLSSHSLVDPKRGMKHSSVFRVLLEKLIVAHILKKLPALHGTQKCITVFTRSQHGRLLLSQNNPMPILTPDFFKINLNTIRQSTPRSSKYHFFLQNVRISHLFHACYMPRQFHPHRFGLILKRWHNMC
jgi:hypothetical protein